MKYAEGGGVGLGMGPGGSTPPDWDNLKSAIGIKKAEGGEIPEQSDDDAMMDGVAQECMDAIQSGDKDSFKSSIQALVADIVNKMSTDMDSEGE